MHELAQGRIDVAVFLSVRTAAVFCSLIIAAGLVEACARVTAVAISRKVAEALRLAGFRRVVGAGSTNRDAVVDAVLQARDEDA
jgi:uroporphyrinogen-III synthase